MSLNAIGICGLVGAGAALAFWVGFLVGIHYRERTGIDFDWLDRPRRKGTQL